MISYKELGLVNTRKMFAKAVDGGYAIPAFNFNNMEQMQAIIMAAVETKSPVILQVSKGARNYANQTLLRYMAQGAVEYAKELGCAHPEIVLHLDHGDSFELCKSCIDMGFSSVMIDGSALPYDENVALTKKVVDYAHQFDVTVEGELGGLLSQGLADGGGHGEAAVAVDVDLADGALGGLAQLLLRDAHGGLQRTTVLINGVDFVLRHRRRAVQHDGEAGQFLLDGFKHVEGQRRRYEAARLRVDGALLGRELVGAMRGANRDGQGVHSGLGHEVDDFLGFGVVAFGGGNFFLNTGQNA